MTSIKDVAQHAGVSTTTVSRVLLTPQAVRPVLRTRVQEAIKALAYRPNLTARRLRQGKAWLIGLIVSDIRNPFFTDVSRAVEDLAYHHGLRLVLCNSDEDPVKQQAYLELMADEQASGVILAPAPPGSSGVPQLQPKDWPFPMVLLDRAPSNQHADSVVLDNQAAARQAAEHLLSGGYRKIAMLAGSSITAEQRCAGYAQAMKASGLATQILRTAPTRQAGAQAVSQALKASRPEAVLASNGLLLMGALQAIGAAGLITPTDIGLAGFDDNDWASLPALDVTTIAQPTYAIGQQAVQLLLQRIQEPSRSAHQVVLPGQLIVRRSSQPALA